jgi:hypothetical protein
VGGGDFRNVTRSEPADGGLNHLKNLRESKMKKFLIVGVASAALMGFANVSVSLAQTGDNAPAQSDANMAPADNQISNDVDARIAQLKSNLRLTVDQEKNWSGLQTALHDYGVGQLKSALEGKTHPSRRDREEQSQTDRVSDIALMRKMADGLAARAASLKKLADAAEPLYGSLDQRQRSELFDYLRTDFEKRRR